MGIGALAGAVIALHQGGIVKQVHEGRDPPVGGAGAQGEDDVAGLAHGLGHLQVLLIADAPGDDAHRGLGDFQMVDVAFPRLAEVFMVHEHRDVDELQVRQHRKEGFPQIKDGHLAAGAGIEPF